MSRDEEPIFELGDPGPMRDRLVTAVLGGQKVATSSLWLQYEEEGEPLPVAGQRCVMVDSEGMAVARIELTQVRVIRLGDADAQLAVDEGEGFGSVAEWRKAHEEFWRRLDVPGLRMRDGALDDDTEVVVERFRVVEVL